MRRYFLLLVVLFGSVLGCSRPNYKGYVPVTEKEAAAFAQDLIDKTEKGDVSWLPKMAADMDAMAATYALVEKRIPEDLVEPTEEDRAEWKKAVEKLFGRYADYLETLTLSRIEEEGNTYDLVMEFDFNPFKEKTSSQRRGPSSPGSPRHDSTHEVFFASLGAPNDNTFYLTLLKKSDTGEIVVANVAISGRGSFLF